MKSFIKKIVVLLLGHPGIRSFVLNNLLAQTDKDDKSRNVLLSRYRRRIVRDIFTYPSVINNGYLHIERAIEIVKSRAVTGSLVLDIGAASGETCILFTKAFPTHQVIGFEPIAETFRTLESNTKNFPNIKIHHTALGSNPGKTEINITNRITASSLLDTNASQGFNGGDYFTIVQKEQITVNILDNMIPTHEAVVLIKMDVQGFELEVLRGAMNTLKKTSFVLLEMQNHEIYKGAPKYFDLDSFLRACDFELFEIIPSIRERDQIKEFDALYINKALSL